MTPRALLILLAGCGQVASGLPDAPPVSDGPPGGADGASGDAACVDTPIFLGGTDPATQGWALVRSGLATVSPNGPTITRLETQTSPTGAGAQQLLSKAVLTPGQPFVLELSMQVETVDSHNFLDGAAVLMGSYSGGFGDGVERAQMLYVDRDMVGWTDDTQAFTVNSLDNMFHLYRLAVDAGGNAVVSRDGVDVLQRAGFTTNGTVAFGDQTNDPGIESALLIRSITLICPP